MADTIGLKELAFKVLARRGPKTISVPRLSSILGQSGTDPEITPGNPYAKRMQAALCENRPDYPAGMIFWLETSKPEFYAELTERLPEEIHRLWEDHAPLEEFERTLGRLVATHQRAVVLYREHLMGSGSRKEKPPAEAQ